MVGLGFLSCAPSPRAVKVRAACRTQPLIHVQHSVLHGTPAIKFSLLTEFVATMVEGPF